MCKKIKNLSKKLLIFACVTVLLLSNSFSVSAMGFDFDEISESVFVVLSVDIFGEMSLGSGFAIGKHHIVTNAHVIINQGYVEIGCYSEEAENNIGDMYMAEVISIDNNIDIAILYVDDVEFTPLEFADISTIKEGDSVYAIGAPQGLPYTLTSGTVSSKKRVVDDVKYVQTSTPINPGNSGGPLLNDAGQVVGINTLKFEDSENIGFAIRSDTVQEYIANHNINLVAPSNSTVIPDDSSNLVSSSTTISRDDHGEDSKEDQKDFKQNYSKIIYIALSVLPFVISTVLVIIKISLRSRNDDDAFEVEINPTSNSPLPQSYQGQDTVLLNKEIATNKQSGGICILSGNMRGAEVTVDQQPVVIGKDPSLANLILNETYLTVSRVHCTINYSAEFNKYFVTDSSSNGTYLQDGTRLIKNRRTPVARGTVLKLADENCKIKLI